MYGIDWQTKAYRQLHKIRSRQSREEDLRCGGNAPSLAGLPERKGSARHEYGYRMRVGDWRILFDVQDRIRIAMIQEVKKRDERTY